MSWARIQSKADNQVSQHSRRLLNLSHASDDGSVVATDNDLLYLSDTENNVLDCGAGNTSETNSRLCVGQVGTDLGSNIERRMVEPVSSTPQATNASYG